MIQPDPKDEPRMSPYEAPKVHVQKDEPIHEEGCAICDSVPRGTLVGDHTHTAKEYRGLGEAETDKPFHEEGCTICDSAPPGVAVGDHTHTTKERTALIDEKMFADAEKRDREKMKRAYAERKAAHEATRARTKLDAAQKKTNIESFLVEIHAMFKELMVLRRRKFVLKQKLFAFQFAPETSDEGSIFDLESIAVHRLKLLQKEMGKD